MNTNNNIYTVVYTAVIVIIVAAVLALASSSLKSKQEANEKAEVISQILTAGKFGEKSEWTAKGNDAVLAFYSENVAEAYTVNAAGEKVSDLDIASSQVYTVSDLKAQNYNIKDGKDISLPVYIFKNGTVVLPIYGAGLWGPVWGYIGFDANRTDMVGAYFDHASETPGLGGKIKDDPAFRAMFAGKSVDFNDTTPFAIVKGGAPEGKANAVDAISGATMTSNGVSEAINSWLGAFRGFLAGAGSAHDCENCTGGHGEHSGHGRHAVMVGLDGHGVNGEHCGNCESAKTEEK